MAQALADTWKRRLAADKAGGKDEQSESGSEDAVDADKEAGDEQRNSRILNRVRNNDRVKALEDKARAKVEGAVEKKLEQAATNILSKVITVGLSSTIVLLIIPYLLWTRKVILGNLLHFPSVEKLKGWELGVWCVVTFILAGVCVAIIALIVVAIRMIGGDIKLIGKALWDFLKNVLHLKN